MKNIVVKQTMGMTNQVVNCILVLGSKHEIIFFDEFQTFL